MFIPSLSSGSQRNFLKISFLFSPIENHSDRTNDSIFESDLHTFKPYFNLNETIFQEKKLLFQNIFAIFLLCHSFRSVLMKALLSKKIFI